MSPIEVHGKVKVAVRSATSKTGRALPALAMPSLGAVVRPGGGALRGGGPGVGGGGVGRTVMTAWASKAVTEKVDGAGLDLGDGDLGSAPVR